MARSTSALRNVATNLDDADKAALIQAIQAVNEAEEHVGVVPDRSSSNHCETFVPEQRTLNAGYTAERIPAQSPLDACADAWAQYCIDYWSNKRPVQPLWTFLPTQLAPQRQILKPVSPFRKFNKGIYPGNASVLKENNPPPGKIAVYSTMYAVSVAESWPEARKQASPKKRSSLEVEEAEHAAYQRSKHAKTHHGFPKRPCSGRSLCSPRSTTPSTEGLWAMRRWSQQYNAFRSAGRMYRFILNKFRPAAKMNGWNPADNTATAEAERAPAGRVVQKDHRLKDPSECRPRSSGACGLPGLAQSRFAPTAINAYARLDLDTPCGSPSDRCSMAPGAVISKVWLQEKRGIHGKGSLVDSQWATDNIKEDVQAFDGVCCTAPTLSPGALQFLAMSCNAKRSSSWTLPAIAATCDADVPMTAVEVNTAGLLTPPGTPCKPDKFHGLSTLCMDDIEMSDAAPAVESTVTQVTTPATAPAPASRAVPRPKGARAPILLSF